MRKGIQITAHSGCEDTKPNSWEYFDKAHELSCDFIEIDIRKRIGKLWLSHNEIATTKGLIRLADAVKYMKEHNLFLNCDLKEPIFEEVYQLLLKMQYLDHVVFSGSVKEKDIYAHGEAVNQILFNVENIYPNKEIDENASEWIINEYKRLGIHWINIDYHQLNSDFIKRLTEENIKVSTWTVDQEADMEYMMQLGVSNITTHRVGTMKLIQERYGY